MATIKVTNRSDGNVTYTLEELRVRRVFNINETKEIDEAELRKKSKKKQIILIAIPDRD